MIVFPAIAPTTRSFKDGVYPDKSSKTYAGIEYHRPLCSVSGGYELTLGYTNLDQVEGLLAYNTYLEAKGNFEAITLPTEVFRGMDNPLYWRVQGSIDNTKWYCNNVPVKTFGTSGTLSVEFTFINYAVTNLNPFDPNAPDPAVCTLWGGEQTATFRVYADPIQCYEGSSNIEGTITLFGSEDVYEFYWQIVYRDTLEPCTYLSGANDGYIISDPFDTFLSISTPGVNNPIPVDSDRNLLLLLYILVGDEYVYDTNYAFYVRANSPPRNVGGPIVGGQGGVFITDPLTTGTLDVPQNFIPTQEVYLGVFGFSAGSTTDDANWSITDPNGDPLPDGTFTDETELSGTIPFGSYITTPIIATPRLDVLTICCKAIRVSTGTLVDSKICYITPCTGIPDPPNTPVPD